MTDPVVTLVSAVYDVAPYLPEFIAGIDAQTVPDGSYEVIAVDDGSTDDSLRLLREWEARRPDVVRVVTQPNQGQASARNRGLELARGEWVGFPDPDDVLAPDYLEKLLALGRRRGPALLVANLRFLGTDGSGPGGQHPLSHRFRGRESVVDLDRFPEHFQLSGCSVLFRRDVLLRSGLRFDPRVRPVFEDAHLIGRYLLLHDRPTVGLSSGAVYHYRRRADGSSTLQRSRSDPGRFTTVLRHGYLDLLRTAAELKGTVPRWVQNTVVYELNWLLGVDESVSPRPNAAALGVAEEFHALMAEITSMLDREAIQHLSAVPLSETTRIVLEHGYRTEPWVRPWVHIDRIGSPGGLVRLRYYYTGPAPTEELLSRGHPARPVHHKTRALPYSGRALVRQRILWVRMRGSLELRLNGEAVPLTPHPPPRPRYRWLPTQLAAATRRVPARGRRRLPLAERLARSRYFARRYEGAWLLVDRLDLAGDNAEHLFRFLRRRRPEINTWFVLKRSSPDWRRMRRSAGGRLVPFGSLRWRALYRNAAVVVSSHIDRPVHDPPQLAAHAPRSWRYVFLQHGVTKDDITPWLDTRPLDLVVTTTPAEAAFLAGDDGPGQLTTREVVLTGMPRLDRLRAVGARVPVPERTRLLVMPTWREHLTGRLDHEGVRSRVQGAAESPFVERWRSLLADPHLQKIVRDHGLRICLFPHPNLADLAEHLVEGTEAELLGYGRADVQETLASAFAVVTDYSSVAFDAAVIARPVVYYQFDRDVVLGGGHTYRPGYFSYVDDGFGPVCTTPAEVSAAVTGILEAGGCVPEPYRTRAEEAFGHLGGSARRRTVAEIERMLTGRTRQRRFDPSPPFGWSRTGEG